MINKKNITLAVLIIIILIVSSIIIVKNKQPEIFMVNFIDIEDSTMTLIIDHLTEKYPNLQIQISTDDNYDIIFTNNMQYLNINSDKLYSFTISTGLMPTSMRNLGIIKGEKKTIPLQLNHVELAIRSDILNNSDNYDPTLKELKDTLIKFKSPNFFPLIIAGKNNTALMDLISLLTVTFSGSESNEELLNIITAGNDFDSILDMNLTRDIKFKNILDELISWRRIKLLHPEWLQLDKETVLDVANNDLAGAIIMRLSDHRRYPTNIIENYTVIPFPDNKAIKYTSDILAITLLVSIPLNSENKIFSQSVISEMIKKEFQKELTFSTGMAPVNSTVIPMDKQSSDLRFWAASSNRIASAYYKVFDDNVNITSFLDETRAYLITNK